MSATRSLLLLGGGGHAAVVADAARAAGFDVIGALDDNPAATESLALVDLDWLGTLDDLARLRADFPGQLAVHAAVGHNGLRRTWLTMMCENHDDLAQPPIAHPSAIVAPSATIGNGV